MADRMRASLGKPVIIENAAGAGGTIGVARAVRANPDGYTLSIGSVSVYVLNAAVYPIQYDPLKDLQPIAPLTSEPLLIVTRKTMPASDLKELITWLKANSDKATQGHAGAGTAPHLAGILFQKQTGTHFQFIPYRGTGPSMLALVGGQIDMEIDPISNSLPQVQAGRIKVYAVAAPTRLSAAPDIPTVDEAGLPGFYVSLWYALWAPKGVQNEVITKLNIAVQDALAETTIRKRLTDLGHEIFPSDQQSPEVLAAYHRAEIDKWWPIIKEAGIKAE
jgi:tripartite-type tricarboxylate transporter receptor subunit TctC